MQFEARSRNYFLRGKATSNKHRVSVALLIQQAMRMRRATVTSVASLALAHFATLSYKQHGFPKRKAIEHKRVF
jgi:hypothetical protein